MPPPSPPPSPPPRRPGSSPTPRRARHRRRQGSAAVVSALALEGAAGRDRVCLGAIAGAHGVHGEVRIKSFTDRPEDVAAYGPLTDEAGARTFEVEVVGTVRGGVRARIAGVADREAAEALRGTRLYAARAALPPTDAEEFYHADLLGLEAAGTDGRVIGRVSAILPAGAIDVLEIDRGPGTDALLVPFTREAVPVVAPEEGRLVVVPPEEGDDEPGEP